MSLTMVVESSGRELDVVSLRDGRLVFETGAAEDVLRFWRLSMSDREVYDLVSRGWSNGYVTLRPD